MQNTSSLYERQTTLIQMNTRWLRQVRAIVSRIDDHVYCTPPRDLAPLKVGSHLRHVLEFYECFLEGLESAHIDYDGRRRDEKLEKCRMSACGKIDALIEHLENTSELLGDGLLFVRAEDASALGLRDPFVLSSVGRELVILSGHTIHHFALIAIALRAHGIEPGDDFGVAPSTLRHLADKGRVAA